MNYSFIKNHAPGSLVDYDEFLNPVIAALKFLGINAAKSRTSDITIDGKKISGSAQAIAKRRILHHGTLLFDTDLLMLNDVLKAAEGEFTSNAVKSNRSTVTNIKEHMNHKAITIDEFQILLLKAMFPGGIQKVTISDEQVAAIKSLVKIKYSSWHWNYGYSPKFSYVKESNLAGESVSLRVQVEKGMIVACELLKGGLPLSNIENAVVGSRYSYTKIKNRLDEFINRENTAEIDTKKLAAFFF